ncbi:MAG: Rv3235 family protein [Nocardioidaceae bacterium]
MTMTAPAVQPLAVSPQRSWHAPDPQHGDSGQHFTQGALALSYPMPSGLPAEPRSSALTVVRESGDPAPAAPDARDWAARFMQAVVEVVSSDRPLTQLVRWTNTRVYDEIGRRQRRVVAHRSRQAVHPRRQQVATVHISQPAPDSAEVAARVAVTGRSRAIAARLDFMRGRWLCTAIAFG